MTVNVRLKICMALLIFAGAAGLVDAQTIPRLTISDRTIEPLLKADKPWEDFCIGYCTVIRTAVGAGERWQMWYAAYDHNYHIDADGVLCYAESDDGVHCASPNLA